MPLFKKKEEHHQQNHSSHSNNSQGNNNKPLPHLQIDANESDYSLYNAISNTSISDLPHSGNALSSRSRTSSMSSKFKNLFSSSTSLVDEGRASPGPAPNLQSPFVSTPPQHAAVPQRSSSVRVANKEHVNGTTPKKGINPDIIHKQKPHPSSTNLNASSSSSSSSNNAVNIPNAVNRSPVSQPTSPPISAPGSYKSPVLEPQLSDTSINGTSKVLSNPELSESLTKLKIMPSVIENDIDDVLSKSDDLYSLSDNSSPKLSASSNINSNPMTNNKSTSSTHLKVSSSNPSSANSTLPSQTSQQQNIQHLRNQQIQQQQQQQRGRSMLPKFFGGNHGSADSRSVSPESRSDSHTELSRRASISMAQVDQYNHNNSFYNNLKHTATNVTTVNGKNHKDVVIVKSGRVKIFNNGEYHEHDYSKYRTQPTKSKAGGLWSWTRRKDTEDQSDLTAENSISLLPDGYSTQLMDLKSKPENYRWNYDESDDENSSTDSEQDSEDNIDDVEDDFDDEADNELIDPIIGKDQLNLINLMMDKIEHPDKFREKLVKSGSNKLPLFKKFGHIEGTVGRGSYGTVKIAIKCDPEDKKIKKLYAIKQLKQRQNESLHHFGNRVTSEFMISSSLTHQAITNVYDLMVDPVTLTYSQVMEYIPCGDLFTLISVTNGLEVIEADCFFKQILNAITYLHSVGISHNDLKVENLLLTKIGQLKITDFGTSAVFKTAWEDKVQMSKGACGSERYVSPEQFSSDKEYDPRLADIWSLGIIYLVMLYGTYVWEAAKPSDADYEHFLETRAIYDYTKRSSNSNKQYKVQRKGVFNQIESISKGYYPNSRRYVLYNILQPDPKKRMRSYQIWQSDWVKSIHVCDAGRGYVGTDEYLEMAKHAYMEYHDKNASLLSSGNGAASVASSHSNTDNSPSLPPSRPVSPMRTSSPSRAARTHSGTKTPTRVSSPSFSDH